jgi:hypothetical protein
MKNTLLQHSSGISAENVMRNFDNSHFPSWASWTTHLLLNIIFLEKDSEIKTLLNELEKFSYNSLLKQK